MNDNAPYKSRIYSPWPVVVLLLFFGAAISLWSNHHIIAVIVGAVGILVYGFLNGFRTRMMQEEFSFRSLFKSW